MIDICDICQEVFSEEHVHHIVTDKQWVQRVCDGCLGKRAAG